MTTPSALNEQAGVWSSQLRKLWDQRRILLRLAVGAFVAAALVMLTVPETYRARAVLLPPQQEGTLGLAAAMLAQSGIEGAFPVGGGGNLSSDLYVEILKSRSVADRIIDSLGLCTDYDLTDKPTHAAHEAARKLLERRVSFRSSLSGVVTIEADHQTGLFPRFRSSAREHARRRSAEIANAFCEELDRVNVDRSMASGRTSRAYLEGQLAEARRDLQQAAQALVGFQRVHGAISIEAQTRVAIEAAGELKSQIMAKKVELGLALRTDSERSPRVRLLRSEIEEMEGQYRSLDLGIPGLSTGGSRSGLLDPLRRPDAVEGSGVDPGGGAVADSRLPMNDLPDVAFRYSELLRDVKAQETLIEVLTQQYYEAKLQESKDIPTIQVLDAAVPPVQKQAPKRTLTVAAATLLAVLAGVVGILASDEIRRFRDDLRRS